MCARPSQQGEGLKPYGAFVFELVCIEIIQEFNIRCVDDTSILLLVAHSQSIILIHLTNHFCSLLFHILLEIWNSSVEQQSISDIVGAN
jgi:hypothetical protein